MANETKYAKQAAPKPAQDEESVETEVPPPVKPDIRLVQVDKDKDGNTRFNNVGGMWEHVTKNGNKMWNVRIGNLRLQAYPNDKKD